MLSLFFLLAAQGLTLKSGKILICDSFAVAEGMVVIQLKNERFTLPSTKVNWQIPIQTISHSQAPQQTGHVIEPSSHEHAIEFGPEYVLEKLEVNHASLIDVLRLLADQVGFNLFIDGSVPDTHVTFSFKNIRWQDAVNTLLRFHQLDFEFVGGSLMVKPLF